MLTPCFMLRNFLFARVFSLFNKLPAMRSCTAGAKILVTQWTFFVILVWRFSMLFANCACWIVCALCSHGAVSSCEMEHRICNLVGMRVKSGFVYSPTLWHTLLCAFGEPSSSSGVLKPCVNVYVCDIAETSLSKRTETIVPYSACSVLYKSSRCLGSLFSGPLDSVFLEASCSIFVDMLFGRIYPLWYDFSLCAYAGMVIVMNWENAVVYALIKNLIPCARQNLEPSCTLAFIYRVRADSLKTWIKGGLQLLFVVTFH